MLKIIDLHVEVEGKEILKGINLEVKAGEIHAIMGPNGSGKSTLASVITGRDKFKVMSGDILFEGASILDVSPENRANAGIFLSFQYPVEIPGVGMPGFMKAAVNARRRFHGLEPMNATEFLKLMRDKATLTGMDAALVNRPVNEGFSGGEKKRNEVFQMAILEPKLAILDETDSGLDIDALKIVAEGVNRLRTKDNALIVITHYQRLLEHIVPDFVHVLYNGRIVKSAGRELAAELELTGYDEIKANAN